MGNPESGDRGVTALLGTGVVVQPVRAGLSRPLSSAASISHPSDSGLEVLCFKSRVDGEAFVS